MLPRITRARLVAVSTHQVTLTTLYPIQLVVNGVHFGGLNLANAFVFYFLYYGRTALQFSKIKDCKTVGHYCVNMSMTCLLHYRDLKNHGLSGSLPDSIGNLTGMQTM